MREGIRTRNAYGASATRATKAVLCAMMEAEQLGDAPARDQLTVEHVLPQKLTDDWKLALGDDAERIHGWYRDRLANLTVSGVNAELGAKPFEEKRPIMKRSGVLLTRRIAEEDAWNEAALERRAEDLADSAIWLWRWSDPDAGTRGPGAETWRMKWRIEGGDWHEEHAASQMVLNVAGALLTRDPMNVDRLTGDAVSSNLQPASQSGSPAQSSTTEHKACSTAHQGLTKRPFSGVAGCSGDLIQDGGYIALHGDEGLYRLAGALLTWKAAPIQTLDLFSPTEPRRATRTPEKAVTVPEGGRSLPPRSWNPSSRARGTTPCSTWCGTSPTRRRRPGRPT